MAASTGAGRVAAGGCVLCVWTSPGPGVLYVGAGPARVQGEASACGLSVHSIHFGILGTPCFPRIAGLPPPATPALPHRFAPQENQPADADARKSWGWWKAKKWVMHIAYRLFNRCAGGEVGWGLASCATCAVLREMGDAHRTPPL